LNIPLGEHIEILGGYFKGNQGVFCFDPDIMSLNLRDVLREERADQKSGRRTQAQAAYMEGRKPATTTSLERPLTPRQMMALPLLRKGETAFTVAKKVKSTATEIFSWMEKWGIDNGEMWRRRPEFRDKMLGLLAGERTRRELASEFGVHVLTLTKWEKEQDRGERKNPGSTPEPGLPRATYLYVAERGTERMLHLFSTTEGLDPDEVASAIKLGDDWKGPDVHAQVLPVRKLHLLKPHEGTLFPEGLPDRHHVALWKRDGAYKFEVIRSIMSINRGHFFETKAVVPSDATVTVLGGDISQLERPIGAEVATIPERGGLPITAIFNAARRDGNLTGAGTYPSGVDAARVPRRLQVPCPVDAEKKLQVAAQM
jgi:hypothetical protein